MRIILILLTLFLLPITAKAEETLKVVTSFTIIADMARNVAGEAAIVESITKPGAEIHDYQPTPGDIVRAQGADLVLWNGMNLERWFERFIQDLENVPSIIVSEGIAPINISGGAYDGKPNPHGWMSPGNALIYIENIQNALSEIDPENAALYAQNAQRYSAEIKALSSGFKNALEGIPQEQRWLVSSEGAFSYLARDLDLKELYIWPINAERQGTPQQIAAVIKTVQENNIPVIFSESTISDQPARQVAEDTNARYGGVLYVDSLSGPEGKVPTYLDLLTVTTDTIAAGFAESAFE